MVDERLDSARRGIAAPPESKAGQKAAKKKQRKAAKSPPIGGGMGGTSDAETAPGESQMNRALPESETPGGRPESPK